METIIFHPEKDTNAIAEAAAILRRGGLLGIPTETVYGLGADGLNEDAVRRIFEAKGRPQDNPLILHVPDAGWLERCCVDVPETAYALETEYGILTRCGLHCAPSAHRTLGTFPQGTVRFSLGFASTEADVDAALHAIRALA